MTEETKKTIEAPLTSWVRGGSTTSAWDSHVAQQKHDAAQRRAVEDSRAQAVAQDPLGARQYTRKLGGVKDFASIVLQVKHPKDNTVLDYIECELNADEDGSLILIYACYKCALRGVTDNITIRQKHRHFELDTRRQGELWVNPITREPRTLAGTITMTEKFTCPNLGCGVRCIIDNSIVREV